MKRLALIAFSLAAAVSAPAFAQDDPGDSVELVIVYGNDACPASAPDAKKIVVCPRLDEDERYRIPPNLRESNDPANQSWATRVKSFETVGNFGTLSCSASGYGGWSGCTQQLIDAAYEERKGGPGVKAAQLIAEERAKRLSTIDADAAAEQERVEQIEKEYDAKNQAEADAAAAAGNGGQ
jgi:hypothetical protein